MEETKRCPYCGEEILAVAKKCKHCGEWLEPKEPEKEKKPCPICGEMLDVNLKTCPYCKEPISDMQDAEVMPESTRQEPLQHQNSVLENEKSDPYKSYVKLAFGAVVLGTVLNYATDCADLSTSETGGLIGIFLGFGHSIPSWLGACLDGIGTIFLLWNVAVSIRLQKRAEGRDDDATSLLLRALAILYVTVNVLGSFAKEGVIAGVCVILLVLTGILMVINGFILKSEKDSMLANTGKAFIANAIIDLFMLRAFYKSSFDITLFVWLALFSYIAWIYAMFAAHKYLLKRNK